MIKQIAKTAHAVHRAYCIENNIPTQPKWDVVETPIFSQDNNLIRLL